MREAGTKAKGLRGVLMQVGKGGSVVGIDTKEAATKLAKINLVQQVTSQPSAYHSCAEHVQMKSYGRLIACFGTIFKP